MRTIFSIIIPTYNRANFLLKAIESVLSQTLQDWELIIVDDGSTDNTKEVVFNFIEDRITYIYQKNAERSAARNNGIRHASGEYVCFLDSDDYYDDNYLEILFREIKKKNFPIGVFSTGYKIINNKDVKKINPLPEGKSIIKKLLTEKKTVSVSQCVSLKILKEFKFDERFSLWEDTHLFFRIFSKYQCFSIHSYPINAVIHSNSTVFKGTNIVKISDVDNYLMAIKDVKIFYLNNSLEYNTYFINYEVSKLQMYIYQARMNCQYNLVNILLTKYFINYLSKKTVFYFALTLIKNCFSLITGIKIK